MTYIHLFEAAEKLTEMQWPDTITDAEAFKVIESSLGVFEGPVKPRTDSLLAVRALAAARYRAAIKRLLDANKLKFYAPLTRLEIGCDDATDPLVKLEELQELLNKSEPAALNKDKSSVKIDDLSPEGGDEILSALFDSVPVEALEKMFPASDKWKSWAEKAKSNGLITAREKRRFNPYKAAVWFVSRGMTGWDIARCYRVLANNLPARSLDKRHLLTYTED